MKHIKITVEILSVLLLLLSNLKAIPEGSIILDHIDGNVVDSSVGTGAITFNFRVNVFPTSDSIGGITNGFKIYSPDGATWTPPVGDTTGGIGDPFDLFFAINYFSTDGIDADTIGYAGSRKFSPGLLPGYNEIAFLISLETQADDNGKTICVDSSWFPNTGKWLWANLSGSVAPPDWGGPYCYTIDTCLADTNDSDSDGISDICDICPFDPDNDFDSDGICGDVDNCPDTYNPNQHDFDGDGIGDSCDVCPLDPENDADGDGICETLDNCPDTYNPSQNDIDGDGKGDACDVGEVLFTADVNCGSNPLTVNFTDQSVPLSSITSWQWDFGDGSSSFAQNPAHEYNEINVFDVRLIISDGVLTDTLIKEAFISTQTFINADLDAFPKSGQLPLVVIFDAFLDGTATSYLWDFGDGNFDTLPNPIHTYTSTGIFVVQLIATLEQNGCNFIDTVTKLNFITVSNLDAEFSADPIAGDKPLIVQFTDQSSGSPTSWYWDFGDNFTSTDQNPIHNYTDTGFFDVFLRVSDGIVEDSTLKQSYIRVDEAGVSNLSAALFGTNEFGELNPRPGYNFTYSCLWTNLGTAPAENCTLKVFLPQETTLEEVSLGYINAGNYNGYFIDDNDTLFFPLSNIDPTPLYGGLINITVNVPPWYISGDTLVCQVWMNSVPIVKNLTDDFISLTNSIISSIEPNNKFASPEEPIPGPKGIEPGTRLTFSVRFSNPLNEKANDTITYVRIVDTLDPDLDLSTLTLEEMSHPDDCIFLFDPFSGAIAIVCDDINLPPNNELHEGEGYVTYSASPPTDISGVELTNTAYIRFDLDDWIMTDSIVRLPGCCVGRRGNIDNAYGQSGADIDIVDLVYFVGYSFIQPPGPEPPCMEEADVNGDGSVDIADLVCLVDFMFYLTCEPADCGF